MESCKLSLAGGQYNMLLDAAQHNHHVTLCPAAAGLEGAGQLLPVREGKTRVVQPDGTEAQLQRVPVRNYIRWAHPGFVAMLMHHAHLEVQTAPQLFETASHGPSKQMASTSSSPLLDGTRPCQWLLPPFTNHEMLFWRDLELRIDWHGAHTSHT